MPRFSVKEIADICKANILGDENLYVNNFIIDSRKVNKDSLFIPIIGENIDAHKFINQVYDNECKVCFCSKKDIDIIQGMTYIFVDDTISALQKLALYYRESLNIPIVAITGSVGKTSTREIISKALSAKYRVYHTKGNENSQIGVPLTILNIENSDEIAIIEMGISLKGEMTKIAKIVKPDVAVITNIGEAHIEFLGSREGILIEKFHIMDYMKKNSKLVVNADDKLLLFAKAYDNIDKINVFSYNNINKNQEKYYIKKIEFKDAKADFIASINGKEISCTLKAYGLHQATNAMLALTVADIFSVDLKLASEKIKEFVGLKGRQNVIDSGNITIIDDSYNASPSSMKAAIDILNEIKSDRKKILILGDMKELGKNEIEFHKDIGRYLLNKKNINIVYTLGELSKNISDISKAYGDFEKVKHFDSATQALDELKKNYKENVILLFKASNSMKLFDIIDEYLRER